MFLAIVTCVLLYTSVYVILGLTFVLLSPAAKPVMESLADVKKCNFLERLRKSVIVFADGAKAWKTESRRLRLTFRNVVHYKMEFCRKTKVKKKVKISGTQKLDQMWRQLKRYIPYNLATKDRCTKKDSKRLESYVWSYAWRYNNKSQMKEKLAKLAAKKNQNA